MPLLQRNVDDIGGYARSSMSGQSDVYFRPPSAMSQRVQAGYVSSTTTNGFDDYTKGVALETTTVELNSKADSLYYPPKSAKGKVPILDGPPSVIGRPSSALNMMYNMANGNTTPMRGLPPAIEAHISGRHTPSGSIADNASMRSSVEMSSSRIHSSHGMVRETYSVSRETYSACGTPNIAPVITPGMTSGMATPLHPGYGLSSRPSSAVPGTGSDQRATPHIARLAEERDMLAMKLAARTKQLQDLERDYAAVTEENFELRKEISVMRRHVAREHENYCNEVRRLTNDVNFFRKQKDHVVDRTEKLEQEVQHKVREATVLDEQQYSLAQQSTALMNKNAELTRQLAMLNTEVDHLKEIQKCLEEQVHELASERDELAEELAHVNGTPRVPGFGEPIYEEDELTMLAESQLDPRDFQAEFEQLDSASAPMHTYETSAYSTAITPNASDYSIPTATHTYDTDMYTSSPTATHTNSAHDDAIADSIEPTTAETTTTTTTTTACIPTTNDANTTPQHSTTGQKHTSDTTPPPTSPPNSPPGSGYDGLAAKFGLVIDRTPSTEVGAPEPSSETTPTDRPFSGMLLSKMLSAHALPFIVDDCSDDDEGFNSGDHVSGSPVSQYTMSVPA